MIRLPRTRSHFIDITEEVEDFADDYAYKRIVDMEPWPPDFFVLVMSMHTTAGVQLMEYEERLLVDMEMFLKDIASDRRYLHDDIHLRDVPDNERKNAVGHLRAFNIPSQLLIPVRDGKLVLGEWQRVVFCEMDPGREREVRCYAVGMAP